MIFLALILILGGVFAVMLGGIGLTEPETIGVGFSVFFLLIGLVMIWRGIRLIKKQDEKVKSKQQAAAPPQPVRQAVPASPQPGASLHCPNCGSVHVQTVQSNRSMGLLWVLFGWWIALLFGTDKYKNVCQMCGYQWTPGRR